MPDVYNRNSVTKKGYNLLAESIATKKPITFTKVVIGDGDDTGLNIDTMTGLVSPKMELPIGNGEKGGDGEYVIQAVLSNKTLESSFFPKEVGLFAKCGDGEEVLYSYSNGGSNVGLMPDKNTPINAEIYNIRTKIGNATNITFVTSDDTYVTKGELTKHNTDSSAHEDILQMFNSYLPLTGGKATGNIYVPTPDGDDNSGIVANTQWVNSGFIQRGSTNSSYNETGYRVFSDGFCIQWGKIVVGGERSTRVTLPIAYTSVCSPTLTVCANSGNPNGANVVSAYAGEIGTTGFTAWVDVHDDINVGKLFTVSWITVGR